MSKPIELSVFSQPSSHSRTASTPTDSLPAVSYARPAWPGVGAKMNGSLLPFPETRYRHRCSGETGDRDGTREAGDSSARLPTLTSGFGEMRCLVLSGEIDGPVWKTHHSPLQPAYSPLAGNSPLVGNPWCKAI